MSATVHHLTPAGELYTVDEIRNYIEHEREHLDHMAAMLAHAAEVAEAVTACRCPILAPAGRPVLPNLAPLHRCGR